MPFLISPLTPSDLGQAYTHLNGHSSVPLEILGRNSGSHQNPMQILQTRACGVHKCRHYMPYYQIWSQTHRLSQGGLLTLGMVMSCFGLGTVLGSFSVANKETLFVHSWTQNFRRWAGVSQMTGSLNTFVGLNCVFQTYRSLTVPGRKLSTPLLLSMSDSPGMLR